MHSHFDAMDGPVLIMALADGAGSASHSADGARAGCSAAVLSAKMFIQQFGARSITADAVREIFRDAREEVRRQANETGCRPRDWASTLLIVVMSGQGTAMAQIGDGSIVIDFGEGFELAFLRDQDMLNVTNFLIDEDAMDAVQVRVFDDIQPQRVLLTSDGLMPVLIDLRKSAPHTPVVERFLSVLDDRYFASDTSELLESLLSHEQVNARTDDDKSIIMAARILAP